MNANDRAITALVSVAHAAVHTYEMAIPLFVVIWLVEFEVIDLGIAQFEVTAWSVGVVVTLGYGIFGAGALPGGMLVDRFGSQRIIGICLFGMGIAYVLLGVAPSMLAIGLALIVWGIAASVYHPAGLSLITKGVEARGSGLAYHGMAGNLGIGLGPLAAAILLLFLGWRTVSIALGVPALVAAAYAIRADFDEAAALEDIAADGGTADIDSFRAFLGASSRLFTGGFALVFLVVMMAGLYYRGILTFLPELLRELPGFEPIALADLLPPEIAGFLGLDTTEVAEIAPQDYFYSGLLLIGVIGQYIGGRVTERFRVEYGIAGAYLVLAILAVLFVPVSRLGLGPLMAVGALLGVFLFVVQPLYQAMVAEYTPSGTRGLAYGYTYLGVFGIGALGGAIAGGILTFADVTALFLTLAAFAVIAAGTGLYLGRG